MFIAWCGNYLQKYPFKLPKSLGFFGLLFRGLFSIVMCKVMSSKMLSAQRSDTIFRLVLSKRFTNDRAGLV